MKRIACPHCGVTFPEISARHSPDGIICIACHRVLSVALPPSPTSVEQTRCWFVNQRGHRIGPFSLSQLHAMIDDGRLTPADQVWRPGMPDWLGVARLAEHDQESPKNAAPSETLEGFFNRTVEMPLPGRVSLPPEITISLSDFQIIKRLGAGGMATVYLARQRSCNRLVALKVLAETLDTNSLFVARFCQEAVVLAELDHPDLVHFLGGGEKDGMYFIAMELIRGCNTARLLRQLGQFRIDDALYIILRCARALCYAYQKHFIHRDIKPDNIFITHSGNVKIADFGLAKSLEPDLALTETGLTLGTPRYMPPEQYLSARKTDHRSDIYALGSVLYHYLTGALPFAGETAMELMLAKEKGHFRPARHLNPEIPQRADLIIDKMLARDPKHRYATYEELIADLERVSTHTSSVSMSLVRTFPYEEEDAGADPLEIVILHDDIKDIFTTQQALEDEKVAHRIHIVASGHEALAFLRGEKPYLNAPVPQLMVLGRNIHDPSVLLVLDELTANPKLHGMPLIVLTHNEDTLPFLLNRGFQVSSVVDRPMQSCEFDQLVRFSQALCVTTADQ